MGEGSNGTSTRESPGESIDLAQVLERTTSHLGGFLDDLRILGSVRSDRLRQRVRTTLSGVQIAVVWGLATAALAVAGIVVLSVGALRAFDALFEDRPGLGGIAAGVSLIVAAVVVSSVRSARAKRAHVRRLEEKYAGMESGSRPGAPAP